MPAVHRIVAIIIHSNNTYQNIRYRPELIELLKIEMLYYSE